MAEEERGLSTRSLALLFLMGVLVCAVFFSFGFLLGYKERSAGNPAVTERVTPTGDTPPAVNPLPEKVESSSPHEAAPNTTALASQSSVAEPGQKTDISNLDTRSATQGAAGGTPAESMGSAPGGRPSAEPASPPPTKQPVASGTLLQVAALQTRQDAEALVKVLKERGYPVFLVTPEEARAGDELFRVRVGPFASRDGEEKTRQKLVAEGFKPFVKR